MSTKAERKQLDATVAAFHANYASHQNWGNERWYGSLYPALAKPTRYAALVNQYVPYCEFTKVIAPVSGEDIRPIQLPKLPSDAEKNATAPQLLLLERVPPTASSDEQDSKPPPNQAEVFLFPTPQPIPTPSNGGKALLSHWNMDAASALGAHMLAVRPYDRVLDLCAAPGGKSIALAQMIFPHLHAASTSTPTSPAPPVQPGCLHSNEVDAGRNKRLAANLRAYLPSTLFARGAVRVLRLNGADGSGHGNGVAAMKLPCGPGGYDRVLLDAPCSSERHVIHAREVARWRRGSGKALARLQAELLMTALRAARVGGRVVYSTCSVETGENDGVVERVAAAVEKERRRFGLGWGVRFELGSVRRKDGEELQKEADEALERLTEETKYGRIAVPDHPDGGQWGPLFFCVITKVAWKP
ncbi:methyltransferase nsun3 [Diplodia corticola]|uniref:NOL1/NOP2/Sun domain family member 4 n=1 Tax=Diplodia corticola TaxID=236234 RepID=A0A1J9QLX7_9PEZI|nr:methyltransferase nsun3 [Diplodia corticola]OJD29066.1 methyltransferase nsun3 [Diplodia corticola]